jgi:hypothetical protein
MDRLTFPETGARYFTLFKNAFVLPGPFSLLSYKFPDMVEGVIREFGAGASTGFASFFTLQMTVDGQDIPPASNTDISLVSVPVGQVFPFFYEIKGGSVLIVKGINAGTIGATVFCRFNGYYYLSKRGT